MCKYHTAISCYNSSYSKQVLTALWKWLSTYLHVVIMAGALFILFVIFITYRDISLVISTFMAEATAIMAYYTRNVVNESKRSRDDLERIEIKKALQSFVYAIFQDFQTIRLIDTLMPDWVADTSSYTPEYAEVVKAYTPIENILKSYGLYVLDELSRLYRIIPLNADNFVDIENTTVRLGCTLNEINMLRFFPSHDLMNSYITYLKTSYHLIWRIYEDLSFLLECGLREAGLYGFSQIISNIDGIKIRLSQGK